jgi:hypothetical protein
MQRKLLKRFEIVIGKLADFRKVAEQQNLFNCSAHSQPFGAMVSTMPAPILESA